MCDRRRQAEEKVRLFVESDNPAGSSRMLVKKAKMLIGTE